MPFREVMPPAASALSEDDLQRTVFIAGCPLDTTEEELTGSFPAVEKVTARLSLLRAALDPPSSTAYFFPVTNVLPSSQLP